MKKLVQDGYDKISYSYRGDEEDEQCARYHGWLDELMPLLPPKDTILDLGCGNGVPVARRFAQQYEVVGIDISSVQVERAKHNVPNARFIHADIASLEFEPQSFGAVVAFYSIIHLPLTDQLPLFRNIYRWLKPGGLFMATVGYRAWTGQEKNWLNAGADMAWSVADEATYLQWLHETGFQVQWTRFVPEDDEGHTLILASK
jgi:SAM-dependent methyltransferase